MEITTNLLSHFFTLKAGNISIHSPEKSLIRSVQEDVFLSVDVKCLCVPTIQWTFMSGLVSRTIGTWQPGVYTNITVDYSSRVQAYDNGSMRLMDLRLQDAGYYVVTVTDMTGSSRDMGLVLKVNGELKGPGREQHHLLLKYCLVACRGAVRGPPVPVRLRGGAGRYSRTTHAGHVATGQGVQKDRGVEEEETDAR